MQRFCTVAWQLARFGDFNWHDASRGPSAIAELLVRGTSHRPVSVSVSVSVTSQCSTKTAKRRITQTTPHDGPVTLVFWRQRSPQNFTGTTRMGTPNAGGVCQNRRLSTNNWPYVYIDKKLSYPRGTARSVVSVEILPVATQKCRNYLYDKSWTNQSYEVGGLQWADV